MAISPTTRYVHAHLPDLKYLPVSISYTELNYEYKYPAPPRLMLAMFSEIILQRLTQHALYVSSHALIFTSW